VRRGGGAEQRSERCKVAAIFRVPLHRDAEPARGSLHCFHNWWDASVFNRGCGHHETLAEDVNHLVVAATDGRVVAEDSCGDGSRNYRDFSSGVLPEPRLVVPVTNHIGEVLVQCSSERHVEQLVPTADGQDRQIHRQGCPEQGEF